MTKPHRDSTRGVNSPLRGSNKNALRAHDGSRKREGGDAKIAAKVNANLSKVQFSSYDGIADLMKGPPGAIGGKPDREYEE